MLTYKPLTNNVVKKIPQKIEQIIKEQQEITIAGLYTWATSTESMCGGTGVEAIEVICTCS